MLSTSPKINEIPPQRPTLEERMLLHRTKSPEELRRIRLGIGTELHRLLITMDLKPKILFDNGVAAGRDTDALASNDGSSKYLAGGLISYSGSSQGTLKPPTHSIETDQSSQTAANVIDFHSSQTGQKDYTLVVGVHGDVSGENAGKVDVYVSDRENAYSKTLKLETDQPVGSALHRQALQELATIAELEACFEFLAPQQTRADIKEVLSLYEPEDDPLLSASEKVYTFNMKMWSELSPLLTELLGGEKLSIGESFTSGILAQIMTSAEGASQLLDYNLNWYDPKFKQMVGVPPKNTEENLIAEPETIALATAGLLKNTPESTKIALGTTGWANYWVEGEADYFSVGVAEKDENEEGPSVSTAYVTMTHSKGGERERGRRQLTRHLGAAVALFMLTNTLSKSHPELGSLTTIKDQLKGVIEEYAEMDFKENVEVNSS